MTFNPIHPSIVDLYVNALTLHLLQEKITELGSDVTTEIKNDMKLATSEFYNSARVAEELFGSSDVVQSQLDLFSSHEGEA